MSETVGLAFYEAKQRIALLEGTVERLTKENDRLRRRSQSLYNEAANALEALASARETMKEIVKIGTGPNDLWKFGSASGSAMGKILADLASGWLKEHGVDD